MLSKLASNFYNFRKCLNLGGVKTIMNKLFFISILLCCCSVSAQTHRFIYELTITKSDDDIQKTGMVLDIDKHSAKFYDYEFLTVDSIRRNTKQNLQAYTETDQLLTRMVNGFENKNYYTHLYDYLVVKSNDKIMWKLNEQMKEVQGIKLHQASTKFGGRDWTAWYNPQIPLQEGPYKFNGLPGMVYEVYDTDNIFHYTLIKNSTLPVNYDTNDFLESRYGKKPIPVSLKQYQQLKLNYYNNIVEVLSEFMTKGGQIASEEELTTPEQVAQRKRTLQQNIKNNYIPLERDKAIPYQ